MKKLASVALIALFFVFAYAFTPATSVVANSELNSISVLEDTTKTTKTTKSDKKKNKKGCSTKCGGHSPKKCDSDKKKK
ncbi:MAG: hypothetical protein DRJ10_21425 [Bacteroidetes bacterium]|nr:MAG: hypothetical protein DRJ10_21425 [Bacteroidota bacterium]